MRKILLIIFLIDTSVKANAQKDSIYFISKEISRVAINAEYVYQSKAIDAANNSISYSVNNLPLWLKWNDATRTISGKTNKAGQYMIDVTANTKTDTAHQRFMLTVYNKSTTNILCLGNSITNGVDTFNSYRRDLWQLLHAGDYNFDFIGSWSKHHMGTDVPVPDFDMDNEGHSGWTFDNMLQPPLWDSARGNLKVWLQNYKPDIVLIELGTNDVFQCKTTGEMFNNLNIILSLLRKKNEDVKIFLAQIPPLGKQWSNKKLCNNDTTYDGAISNLNKQFVVYAKEHSTIQSPLTVVDQYTAVNPATDMFDDIHPNIIGEKLMAERWFEAIKPYLKKL